MTVSLQKVIGAVKTAGLPYKANGDTWGISRNPSVRVVSVYDNKHVFRALLDYPDANWTLDKLTAQTEEVFKSLGLQSKVIKRGNSVAVEGTDVEAQTAAKEAKLAARNEYKTEQLAKPFIVIFNDKEYRYETESAALEVAIGLATAMEQFLEGQVYQPVRLYQVVEDPDIHSGTGIIKNRIEF